MMSPEGKAAFVASIVAVMEQVSIGKTYEIVMEENDTISVKFNQTVISKCDIAKIVAHTSFHSIWFIQGSEWIFFRFC